MFSLLLLVCGGGTHEADEGIGLSTSCNNDTLQTGAQMDASGSLGVDLPPGAVPKPTAHGEGERQDQVLRSEEEGIERERYNRPGYADEPSGCGEND